MLIKVARNELRDKTSTCTAEFVTY